jgi:hypothetical protein
VFDEASGIADKIWQMAEGALTDQDTEILWPVSSNPTKPDGAFFECMHRQPVAKLLCCCGGAPFVCGR